MAKRKSLSQAEFFKATRFAETNLAMLDGKSSIEMAQVITDGVGFEVTPATVHRMKDECGVELQFRDKRVVTEPAKHYQNRVRQLALAVVEICESLDLKTSNMQAVYKMAGRKEKSDEES